GRGVIGTKVWAADPVSCPEAPCFASGGVPPIGHAGPPLVRIAADLMGLDAIWAAAGTPNAVFRLTPAQLVAITGGRVEAIRKD
ncbi:YbaK/EbsC family protein, partial [Azospirillum brasilense]|nr:YbaK/EbsC family protein [Azospirillum brasilense]